MQETPHWLGLTTWFFHYAPNQLVGMSRRVNKGGGEASLGIRTAGETGYHLWTKNKKILYFQ